jgi:hypothetical protein
MCPSNQLRSRELAERGTSTTPVTRDRRRRARPPRTRTRPLRTSGPPASIFALDAVLRREEPRAIVTGWKQTGDECVRRTRDLEPLDCRSAEAGRLERAAADTAGSCIGQSTGRDRIHVVQGRRFVGSFEARTPQAATRSPGGEDHLGEGEGGILEIMEGEAAGCGVKRSVGGGRAPVSTTAGVESRPTTWRTVWPSRRAAGEGNRAPTGACPRGNDDQRRHVVGVAFLGGGEAGRLTAELASDRARRRFRGSPVVPTAKMKMAARRPPTTPVS